MGGASYPARCGGGKTTLVLTFRACMVVIGLLVNCTWLNDLFVFFCVHSAVGNHEYYTGDVDNWISELPKYGVTPLVNSRVCLLAASGGDGGECVGGLYLAGLEDIATRMGM